MTLMEMLEQRAKKYSKRKILIFKDKKINYRELNMDANRLSYGLNELGMKSGDKIAILLGNCPEFIISYFGVLKAGGTAVPLNTLLKAEETRFILNDSGASTLITSPTFMQMIGPLRPRLDKLENIIIVGEPLSPGTRSFNELIVRQPTERAMIGGVAGDVAVIIYTSGTTGHPKGVMLTHHNLISNIISAIEAIQITRRDNFLCLLPMFHSYPFTTCVLAPLYLGARITIHESILPFGNIIKNTVKNRVTIFVAIPPIYNVLVRMPVPKLLSLKLLKPLSPLRFYVSGAAALPGEVLREFEEKFSAPLIEGYGLTEASPMVSLNPLKGVRKPGSIGLPLPNVEVKVVDEAGGALASGQVGELLVRGPNVMKGYYNMPQATKEALRDGWLYTGDMAKIDTQGYIYIVDRKKDMINVRGLKVFPREVEEVIYTHPKVAEAAVIGIKDKSKGEAPKAVVALKPGESLSKKELIEYCKERLAAYKVPREIEFRPELPKTPTGKILKRALREG